MRVKEKRLTDYQSTRRNAETSELSVSSIVRYVIENPLPVAGSIGFFACIYAVMLAFASFIGA